MAPFDRNGPTLSHPVSRLPRNQTTSSPTPDSLPALEIQPLGERRLKATMCQRGAHLGTRILHFTEFCFFNSSKDGCCEVHFTDKKIEAQRGEETRSLLQPVITPPAPTVSPPSKPPGKPSRLKLGHALTSSWDVREPEHLDEGVSVCNFQEVTKPDGCRYRIAKPNTAPHLIERAVPSGGLLKLSQQGNERKFHLLCLISDYRTLFLTRSKFTGLTQCAQGNKGFQRGNPELRPKR